MLLMPNIFGLILYLVIRKVSYICFSSFFPSHSLPKYEPSHEFQTKKKRQQLRQNEEMAKRQKVQHPLPHARLPPNPQTGQAHASHWSGPNHPVNNSLPPAGSGPSHHHYGKPRGPPGGQNRHPSSGNQGGAGYPGRGNQGGGYNSGSYPQGRGQQYAGSGGPSTGSRGPSSGYGEGPGNYSQGGGQYGGSGGGRGQNPNRNQQYGWPQ